MPSLGTVRFGPAAILGLGATGIALAALGQAVTTRTVPAGVAWLVFFEGPLRYAYGPAAESIAAAMVLLAVGAILFALASRGSRGGEEKSPFAPVATGLSLKSRGDYIAIALFAAGAALFATVILRLLNDHYSHWLAVLFFVSLLTLAAPFVRRDLQQGVRLRLRLRPSAAAEVAFLAAVIAVFMFLNLRDLDNWRFSGIGDEYNSYDAAKAIAEGGPFNLFEGLGADGVEPVLISAVHGGFLKLFGGDLFAWKLTDVVIAAATFVPFYLLVRGLFSQRTAMFSTVLLASSHYLFAYVHHAGRVDEFLPTVLALWLLTVGLRRNSTLALFGSGVAAGFGFYVYFAGRIAIAIVAVYLLTFGRKSIRFATVVPILVSFAAVVAPMFAVDRWDMIDTMFRVSVVNFPKDTVPDPLDRFSFNVVRSIMAFNYNRDGGHYVWGSLFDPASAVLYVLGIGLTLSRFRHPSYRLLLVWWVVALAGSGFTNPYPQTATTRLHYVLPAAAALGGLAVDQALHLLHNLRPTVTIRMALAPAALGVLIPIVLFFNLYRFWYETPTNHHGGAVETVGVRAAFSSTCRDRLPDVSVIALNPGPLLAKIFNAYQLGDRTPTVFPYENAIAIAALAPSPSNPGRPLERPPLVPYEEALAAFMRNGEAQGHMPDGCIVVVWSSDARFETLLARLRSRYPDKHEVVLTNRMGDSGATLFY